MANEAKIVLSKAQAELAALSAEAKAEIENLIHRAAAEVKEGAEVVVARSHVLAVGSWVKAELVKLENIHKAAAPAQGAQVEGAAPEAQ